MKYYARIEKKFKPGEIIFSENSEGDGMYIVISGRVRVFKSVGAGADKKEVELCTLGPKSMFGEMSMIDEDRRSATVQAIAPTTCTVITKKIFEDQLTRIPPWMVNLIKILVSRLRETNDRLKKIVEEYTSVPDDMGSIITVDEENVPRELIKKTPEEESEQGVEDTNADKGKSKHFHSEDIVESLFEKDSK